MTAWERQLQQWREHLDAHGADPELIAACARIGNHLAGGATG